MSCLRTRHRACLVALSMCAAGGGLDSTALADEAGELPATVTVIGQRDELLRVTVDPAKLSITQPTTGALLKHAPGANVNFNGPLTGIGQYRGMYSFRVNTKIDGIAVEPAGPNWMDAPLHYAPMPLLESLQVQRGITPVSAGNETIGGHMHARLKTSRFSAGPEFEFHGAMNAATQTVDGGFGVGAVLGASNDSHRFHASGVIEEGDDTQFSGGKIHPTEYDRKAWGLGYGFAKGEHRIGLDYRRNETGDAGTPSLPMDIRYFDADIVSGTYEGSLGSAELSARLHYSDVTHRMDNYSLRAAPPDPARFRSTLAESSSGGFEFGALRRFSGGQLGFGIDGDRAGHDADISNPNNASFFVQNFNDVERDRLGLYAEWTTPVDRVWSYQAGGRYTRVGAEAGRVDGTPAMMSPAAGRLRDVFNSSRRDLSWDNFDAVAKLFYQLSSSVRLDAGLAHKERAPSYQELYLWLPMQATAGLADGKNYVGNLDLKSEQANIVDIGLDWSGARGYFGPRLFYKRVDDYIHGMPSVDPDVIMVSTMMGGDPQPLQFNNVDAEFYGVDADFGWQIGDAWRVDGVLSYVRGKRRDISDNLYRIAPLTSVLGLTWSRNRWTATAEGVFATEQRKVSSTNDETPTPGYGIMNLYGGYRFDTGIELSLGVNNVFDKEYRDHTNGVNRVRNSDVAIGQRMPGPGSSFFARVNYGW